MGLHADRCAPPVCPRWAAGPRGTTTYTVIRNKESLRAKYVPGMSKAQRRTTTMPCQSVWSSLGYVCPEICARGKSKTQHQITDWPDGEGGDIAMEQGLVWT